MCPRIIIDNHKKIYLDNCHSPCTYYVSNRCCPKKYIEVDNCCSKKYIEVDNCCSNVIKVHKHEYDKKIYYCRCCDKYKIKKVKKCKCCCC